MIKAIIVDDEPPARQSLRLALQDIGEVEILEECENGFEAVKSIRKYKPDLVFLDIQMPKLSGFNVIELMDEEMPPVIFVTAYDEFAVKAFEANAVDYLLKPVTAERLIKAINKISNPSRTAIKKMERDLNQTLGSGRESSRILIREGSDVHIIEAGEIIFIEAQDDYMKIHARGREFIKYDRLSNLEKKLPAHIFERIHRSFLLNIRYLKKIEAYSKDDHLAILKTGHHIPISRSVYQKLSRNF
jgi:two-component system LytT family response regulator